MIQVRVVDIVINVIVTIRMCGIDDCGAIVCVNYSCSVSDKCDSYSKYEW